MVDTTTDAHPPPLCDACAHEFHDRCTGSANSPTARCYCSCERATGDRLIRGAIGWDDDEQRARRTRPAATPPVSFTPDEVAELANLAEPGDGADDRADRRPVVLPPPRWSPAGLAWWFYGVAAAGAVIGQTWVALEHVPWGPGFPDWARVGAVLPFALCLELLAMALAWLGDERQRLGERAYGFRAFSAVVAVVAVGILVAGHWPNLYWSGAFGVLSSSAYVLWLLHAAARRRDALRQLGKLDETAPAYGLYRRMRHPIITARAGELAREKNLGLYPSLRAAEFAIRAEKRRPAIAAAVAELVRAKHRDPRMAQIAVTTLDLDRIAAELTDRADYAAWADQLAPAVMAPGTNPEHATGTSTRNQPGTSGASSGQDRRKSRGGTAAASAAKPEQGGPNLAEQIRTLAAQEPELTRAELARRVGATDRYVREVLNGTRN